MFQPDIKLIRSSTLGKKFKQLIEERGMTISEVAEKMGSSQPQLSSVLNGSRVATDSLFDKIAVAIGLTAQESMNLMKEVDKAEYEYKYSETLGNSGDENNILSLLPPDVQLAFRNEGELDKDDINQIAEYIELRRQAKKK